MATRTRHHLKERIARLEQRYGRPVPPPADLFELVLLENCAYLVDDKRRATAFRRCAAYLVVDDVDALFREIGGRGITPAEPPGDTEWHAREMTVVDPDGNKLRFSTAVTVALKTVL